MISYDARPLIKITPSPTATDRRVKVFNFVEAVKTLPCNFTPSELEPITRRVNSKLLGQVRSTFVILSDDQLRKHLSKFSKGVHPPTPANPASGSEVEASEIIADDQVSVISNASDGAPSVSSARGSKRGASPTKGGPAKK